MKKPFDQDNTHDEELREKLIGLGEGSVHKSYYPELQNQLEKLQERVDLAELVAEIGRGLTEERSLVVALQRCAEALVEKIDAVFVRIWVLDSPRETLELKASAGLHTRIDGLHSRLSMKDYPYKVGVIARERKPFLTNKVAGNPLFHNQEWVHEKGVVAFAGYPLLLQKRLVGVIAVFSQHEMSQTVLTTLSSVSDQLSVGIEHYRALDAYRTALSNAQASHEQSQAILRSVADALIVVDGSLRVRHMNKAAERLLGIVLADGLGRDISKVIRDKTLLDYLLGLKGEAFPEDTDLEISDAARGEFRVIQARAAQLQGDQAEGGMVVSLRDVTQEREVARLKSEFVTTAAHELRTPLTAIHGFAELLYDEEWERSVQKEYLSYILDKSDALESIIDDLLDLNRIESGRGLALNYSSWDAASVLKKSMEIFSAEHRKHKFSISIEPNMGPIHADHDKILQVLNNLLSNAIKYSHLGSEVRLEAWRENGSLVVTVADQGIGMTEEQRAKCFEKFYRADSSDTAVGGLGLGLSIVRHVIEGHRGEVAIDSQPGRGTAVTFHVPFS